MKKCLGSLLVLVMLVTALPTTASAAKVGSVAGRYYYTDIVTTLWNIPVNSINIGGRTLIDAESLAHYGFEVNWHADKRWLEIIDNGGQFTDDQANSGGLLDMKSGKTGAIAGKYYHTDIVTTLGGRKIESYNIGGRTFISAENMANYGYEVYWSQESRQLSIYNPWQPEDQILGRWSIPLSGYQNGSGDMVNAVSMTAVRNTQNPGSFDITGSGYQALTGISLVRNQLGRVSLSFSLYQDAMPMIGAELGSGLSENISFKFDAYIKDPKTVVDALNSFAQVYINGERVMISELHYTQGNGHSDYFFVLNDAAGLKKNEIHSIVLFLNVPGDTTNNTLGKIT